MSGARPAADNWKPVQKTPKTCRECGSVTSGYSTDREPGVGTVYTCFTCKPRNKKGTKWPSAHGQGSVDG